MTEQPLFSQELADLLTAYGSKIREIGPKNTKITRACALIANTKPNPEKLFVLEGIWAHNKMLEAKIRIKYFIFCPECIYSNEAVALLSVYLENSPEVYRVSAKTFEKLSERDRMDGLLSVGYMPLVTLSQLEERKPGVIAVLDGLEIPGNIGTIARTCDGAGVDAIFICNRRARLTHPKILKGSMGAVFSVPVIEFAAVSECREWLYKNGFAIYLADTRADKNYFDYDYKKKSALIVGSERYGITKEWYDGDYNMLKIPMLGGCDSLNAGVAASIILYEISMKNKYLK